jgi:hypothetical protein
MGSWPVEDPQTASESPEAGASFGRLPTLNHQELSEVPRFLYLSSLQARQEEMWQSLGSNAPMPAYQTAFESSKAGAHSGYLYALLYKELGVLLYSQLCLLPWTCAAG